jgi:hypothetical protein
MKSAIDDNRLQLKPTANSAEPYYFETEKSFKPMNGLQKRMTMRKLTEIGEIVAT